MNQNKITVVFSFTNDELNTLEYAANKIKMNVLEYVLFKSNNYFLLELIKLRSEKFKYEKKLNTKSKNAYNKEEENFCNTNLIY